jgi:hypothetical protein
LPDKKRFEAILKEEKKEKERNNVVSHSAPAWQNLNFGSNYLTAHANLYSTTVLAIPTFPGSEHRAQAY